MDEFKGVTGESSPTAGVCIRGHTGFMRSAISGRLTRPTLTSTAGGEEVSEAAASITVKPIPISASANRLRGSRFGETPARIARTILQFNAPSMRSNAVSIIFDDNMMPYVVPVRADRLPT